MAEGHWCTSRSPDVSLRGAKRRGNLAVHSRIVGKPSAKSQLPSRDCTPRALPRASRSGRHVGLRPPRNDKSESFTPQNAYRKSCQSAWRSLSAATDAIGACHFNDSLYGSGVRRRARLSPRLQRANSCLAQLRIFVKMYLTFREQADIIKMWKPRRLPQT